MSVISILSLNEEDIANPPIFPIVSLSLLSSSISS